MPLCKQDTKLKMIFGSKWSIFYEIATFSIWELKTLIESESLVEHISFSNYLFAALLSIHISDGSNTVFSNIDRTRTSFFEHRTNLNVFMMIELEHMNFCFEQMDMEHQTLKAFTKYTRKFTKQTETSSFRTLIGLKRVHLLLIELEHPILGFEW